MMRQYELVERVARYKPDVDEALLNRAYVYAMQKHGLQKRASGDPYFSHPLEVAAILTDLKLDEATIAVALLHDTIEDTDATRAEIDALFGEEIGKLVDGLTKIAKLDLVTKKAKQAENFRKLLLAIADDVRVLLVKLADRLHNMRTLHYVPPEKRARIAEETMEIYAPLAGRMGIQDIRDELENLSFRVLNPDAFATITGRLDAQREKNAQLIRTIEGELRDKLSERGIQATVKGREKQPYSIFRKMQRKKIAFEQLSDIIGFRAVVATLDDCYQVLGIVHTTWPTVPGRFKDYISTPKQNDYRSLHTTVVGPGHQRVELQIRTEEMDRIAEYGIAAHALYKDGRKGGRSITKATSESRAYEWLRRTIDLLNENETPEEFLEHTKLELFVDQVFCFTPKGRLIALPRGAKAIDFAYAVHTDVGNTCVGAKINGQIQPVVTELSNGDEVEIIRSKAQTPPSAWEDIVVTGKARAAIRRATREAVRKQYGGLGRHILDRAFQLAGHVFTPEKLEGSPLQRLAQSNAADVLAAVGRGEIKAEDVLKAVFPDYQGERVSPATASRRKEKTGDEDEVTSIPIRGVEGDLPIRFAPNGGAVPGDRIVGILTPGEGVTIYPITSHALKEFDDEPERWVDVRWDIDETNTARFPAQIIVTSLNEPGSLAQITKVTGDNDGNIDNIKMIRKGRDFHDMIIDLEVWDLKHLNRIISQIRTVPIISKVARVNG